MLSLINQRVLQKRTKLTTFAPSAWCGLPCWWCLQTGETFRSKTARNHASQAHKFDGALDACFITLCISLSCSAVIDCFLSCGVSMPTVLYEHVPIWWAAANRRNDSRNTTRSKALAASVQWLQQPQWSMTSRSRMEVGDGRWNFL